MIREPKKFPKKSAEIYPGAFSDDVHESPVDDEGGYGDPHAPVTDERPDFVKADDEDWEKLSPPRQ